MQRELFEKIVQEGVELIPKQFLDKLSNVAIVIEDEPTLMQKKKLKMRGDTLLLGLYEGVPQTQRWNYNNVLPDKITIFKNAIEEISGNDESSIRETVKNTVWHEIAHHFGMDEKQVRKAEIKKQQKI